MAEHEGTRDIKRKPVEEGERICFADAAYEDVCTEMGLKLASFKDFDAWNRYVGGEISEAELADKAKEEIDEYSETFGKYLVAGKEEDREEAKKESEKRERAKRANKIYRRVCREANVVVRFFKDFSTWSDFVEGRISDLEFQEKVRREVEEMIAGSQSENVS